MKHVLPQMPHEMAEIQFFDTVEKLYEIYEVPEDVRAKLLLPLLTKQAKSIVGRLPLANLGRYAELKKFLLFEFKLTPKEYKNRFDEATKRADETYVLFAARLRNLLDYYLRSRDVCNFDSLCNLIISDKMKSGLTQGPLNYVLSLEGEEWFTPDKIANLADIYVNNHKTNQIPRTSVDPTVEGNKQTYRAEAVVRSNFRPSSPRGPTKFGSGYRQSTGPPVKRCFICNSTYHLARSCPKGHGYAVTQYPGDAQVNFCGVSSPSRVREIGIQCENSDDQIPEFGDRPTVGGITAKSDFKVRISPVQRIKVLVNGNECQALCDSGAEVPVVSTSMAEKGKGNVVGRTLLRGLIGKPVEAPLVELPMRLSDNPIAGEFMSDVSLVCAVADMDTTHHDVVLPILIQQIGHKPLNHDDDNNSSLSQNILSRATIGVLAEILGVITTRVQRNVKNSRSQRRRFSCQI